MTSSLLSQIIVHARGALKKLAPLILSSTFLFALTPLSAFGLERFPPPEFEPGYQMPVTTAPTPRADWLEWLDVTVLVLALVLSTYFVLKRRSRNWIVALGVFSLLYFGFYRKGCVCAIGSIQDVSLAVFNSAYAVPLTILGFFLLPIIFALFFGRTFCAAVCPQGAIQDLVLLKPIALRPWLEKPLRVLPFIYLGAAVLFAATGSAFVICEWDPFIALFRRTGSATMLGLGAGILALGIFVGRPYCRFLCPYGALLSVVSRFSKWRVKLSPDDCNQCALCDVACPYGAITEPAQAAPSPGIKPGLAAMLLVTALLVFSGAWLGNRMAVPLSRLNPTVRLAERIAAENNGKFKDATDASAAFRQTGRSVDELYKQAFSARGQFAFGGALLGGFIGLVIGGQLMALSLPRRNKTYEPDRGDCVGCGRCYKYCPKEILRVRKLAQVTPKTGTKEKRV